MPELWPILVIGGPIALFVVMLFVVIRNKQKVSNADKRRADEGSKRLYEQLDRDDQSR